MSDSLPGDPVLESTSVEAAPVTIPWGPDNGPLPLVVGVRGDRGAWTDRAEEIRQAVRRTLASLHRLYPHTPLVLLTSEAPGIDHLAAEVAFGLKVRVFVVRPSGAARAMRGELHEVTSADGLESRTFDDRQYAVVQACIARACRIRLVLGGPATEKDDPSPFGPPSSPLDPPHQGVILYIEPPRAGHPCKVRPHRTTTGGLWKRLVRLVLLLLAPWCKRCWGKYYLEGHADIFAGLNGFNRDVCRWKDWLQSRLTCERDNELARKAQGVPDVPDVPTDSDLQALSGPVQAPVKESLLLCKTADCLARDSQKWARWVLRLLFVFGFLAAYWKIVRFKETDTGLPSFLFQLFLVVIYLIVFLAWLRGWRPKYQDYRALTEGLRVQIFWHLVNLCDGVADHYPRTLRRSLGWVRLGLRNWWLLAEPTQRAWPAGGYAAATSLPYRDLVVERWIQGQASYFRGAAPAMQRRVRCLAVFSWALMIAGVLWLVAEGLGGEPPGFLTAWFGPDAGWFEKPLAALEQQLGSELEVKRLLRWMDIFLGVGLFIMGGLMNRYSKMLGLNVHAERYARMLEMYEQMADYFDKHGKEVGAGEAQAQLKELGREALGENARWFREQRKQDDAPDT